MPVSLPNGDETRIDLVLRHGPETGVHWRVVMECKRSARDYKRWVFFAAGEISPGPSPSSYYFEQADLTGIWNCQGDPPLLHRIEKAPVSPNCPVFDYGVEAKIERSGSGKKASGTEAIEDSFQQVTLGQAGLAFRERNSHALNFRLIPTVVTTAELMSAHFDNNLVSIDRGMINPKDLDLKPRKWLAVNYRISDVICRFSRITTHRTTGLANDLAARQVRTVFVVQAAHIQEFLAWLEKTFPSADPRR